MHQYSKGLKSNLEAEFPEKWLSLAVKKLAEDLPKAEGAELFRSFESSVPNGPCLSTFPRAARSRNHSPFALAS
jgi:hypothetical protein